MPLFTALSLAYSFIVQSAGSLLNVLSAPAFMYIGMVLSICSIAGIVFKKLPAKIWYDLFASGALLAWFGYWRPLFYDDSPIFFFYPLYFAFMTAFVSLFFIQRCQTIDYTTFCYLKSFSDKTWLPPWLVMAFILISLAWHEHYLMFPTMMTILIIRFAITSCVDYHLKNRPNL